jgi:hypothetical protein
MTILNNVGDITASLFYSFYFDGKTSLDIGNRPAAYISLKQKNKKKQPTLLKVARKMWDPDPNA